MRHFFIFSYFGFVIQILKKFPNVDFSKIDQEPSEDASHGTAYNSIISNYYTNDPYYGSKPSKSETIERLKRIFKRRKIQSDHDESKMLEDQTRIDRGMIPAPLLGMKLVYTKIRNVIGNSINVLAETCLVTYILYNPGRSY